jgi:serine/threonine-protein phosphatase 2A regulatory subunit B'
VLIPLHKVKNLSTFNTQLQNCVKIYVEKQSDLGFALINGLLKYWPITSPGKEVIYINEIEEVLELLGSNSESKFSKYGGTLLK